MTLMLLFVEQQAATHCLLVRPCDDVEAVDVICWLVMVKWGLRIVWKSRPIIKASHTNMQNHIEAVNSYSNQLDRFSPY